RASKAAGHPFDAPRTIAALSEANSHFVILQQTFHSGIASYPQLADLMKLGSSRGREWRAWSNSISQALDQTAHTIGEVHRALLETWREFAERLSVSAVTVQTTNIGQQISANAEPVGTRQGKTHEARDRMT